MPYVYLLSAHRPKCGLRLVLRLLLAEQCSTASFVVGSIELDG